MAQQDFSGSDEILFELQSEIIKLILFNIVKFVSGEVQAALSAAAPKSSLAGSFYLRGMQLYGSSIAWDHVKKAISLLEKAIKIDNSFALARASLPEIYVEIKGRWQDDASWLDRAKI